MGLSRLPMLGRLARRYAVRHRGQTIRAVLGLLVATTVLATGLGMGESIATSLEEAALSQLGPIDVILSAQRPFDAGLADGLPSRVPGVAGAATLSVTGGATHAAKGLAEAFATVRGVSAQEAAALGPLRLPGGGAAPEPGPGEVVLSSRLADRLEAGPGDVVTLRVQRAGLGGLSPDDADLDAQPVSGTAGLPAVPAEHAVQVRPDAALVGAQLALTGNTGTVRAELRSPSGVSYANETTGGFLIVYAEPPVAPGEWTLVVSADRPVRYEGRAGAAYLSDASFGGAVELTARVAAVVASEGRAAVTGRPAALVPLADLQRAVGAEGQATHAYYRVGGDPHAAVEAMREALPAASRESFEIRAEKAERMADAEETGAEITGFLLVMGGFTILASVLLAFTLFSALVEERRAELGIMRALGLTRGEVALAMTVEGGLYAFAAALVGLLLGVAILFALLTGIQAVASSQGDLPFTFGMRVSWGTLATALAVGTLLPLATIGLASLRFARLDPARAIRGIPDDPKSRRRLGLGMAAVLVLLGGLLSLADLPRLVGVPIALAGVAVALASLGRLGLALVPAALGVAHVAWTLYTYTTFPEDAGEMDPVLTLARGAVLALGAAALAVASAAPYRALLRALGSRGGRRAPFIAVKYLVARRRPVGLTMAMIAVVVVVVTVMGTLFATFGGTIPDNEAGYGVLGESAVRLDGFPRPPPADVAGAIAAAEFLPRHAEFRQANASVGGEELEVEFGLRQFLGVTDGFAERNEYELDTLAPDYATPRDAWRAVARGEAIMLPDWALEELGVAAGERMTIETALLAPREYVVAGGVRSTFVFQTFLAADHVRAMGFPQATQVFVRVAEGGDPNQVAHRLADLYDEDGLRFTSVPEEVQVVAANVQALVLVFEAFLALGLFVGLAATGFLASRAVHERMRDIGTLRALGFEERDVRRAFMLESTLTAAVGLVLGVLVGLLVAHSVWWREARDEGATFSPPWLILAGFAVAVLGLAALASRGPAKRAAALPPAIAVRHVE